jgi:3'-phosphoadenosine 5'-phosphosulfate sulfotransferase (PAPS reductase)/FAD synthetase
MTARESYIAVSYGGGVNSTAMLIGMSHRGIIPDGILFADTGGERPEVYENIKIVGDWCKSVGFPEIIIVKKVDKNGDVLTLEQECNNKSVLPSVAYGFKTCSQKYKIQPQDKWMNNNTDVRAVWAKGGRVTKFVGFDADEPQRAEKDYTCAKYEHKYPLIDWGWGRDECVQAILDEGLPSPGKSACFFCPNSNTSEIRQLAQHHPDLMDRALKMEANAELTTIKGLGRGHFSWKSVLATDDMFGFPEQSMPCGCYDG